MFSSDSESHCTTISTPFPVDGHGVNEWERGGATNKARNQVGGAAGRLQGGAVFLFHFLDFDQTWAMGFKIGMGTG